MSTFLGFVEEIPGISVDRFVEENLSRCSAFFLSHCHTDHMLGLNEAFFRILKDRDQYIYCTALSKLFLEATFCPTDSSCIRIINPGSPIVVDYVSVNGQEVYITVNSAPAEHSPGSVMFIFEYNDVSVLYTGDFRIAPSDFRMLKPLHYCAGAKILPRTFDKIYLDTTFLDSNYSDFPSREDTFQEVIRVAEGWIARDSRNIVVLECSGNYGSEFLYMELARVLGKKIHVKPYVCESYLHISELMMCITADASSTPIHACMGKFDRTCLTCRPDVCKDNILTIVPSARRWAGRDLSHGFSEWDSVKERRFYVCCSMHSSYNELKAFIEYFKAPELFACVNLFNGNVDIQSQLDEMSKKSLKQYCPSSVARSLEFPFNDHLSVRPQIKSQYLSDDSSD